MIEVRAHASLAELDAGQMERLNRSSRRASPFASPHWLAAFVAQDADFLALRASPLVLAAYEGAVLKGYLPLKSKVDRIGKTLSCLTTLEVERPQVVAAPEEEQPAAQAFFRFLLHRVDDWDVLELAQQEPSSALYGGPETPLRRHWLRRRPDRQNNVLLLGFADLRAHFAGLSKKMRQNVRLQVGGLLATPGLTLLSARTAPARELLFEVFLDVEARSWKPRAGATMVAREATYRAVLADPHSPLEVVVTIACLEGLPLAGSVWAHYGRNTYHLQTAYAESHEALAPGALMTWLPLADALERGSAELNLLPDFSHYKARWGASTVETEVVQLFRLGSLMHLKAAAGDLLRRVLPPSPTAVPPTRNPYKVAAGPAGTGVAVVRAASPERLEGLMQRARAAGALELDVAGLRARGPFS
jgi:CelD/BcsL family acetyltransferase involved in cellulose biosynthesis